MQTCFDKRPRWLVPMICAAWTVSMVLLYCYRR
jgi:hypothetical protein